MEALGQKLKNSREEKGSSIDQVARDTHIAKRYIIALEEEDFDIFPGDTYVLGFLRNYSEYLGLDSQELLTLYKNLRIQEQPAPIDELLERRTLSPVVFIAAGAVLLAGLAIGGFFIFRGRAGTDGPQAEKTAPLAKQYTFQDEILEQVFIQGDEILISRNGNSYVIKIERVAGTVGLIGPVGKLSLKQGEEVFVELTPKGETLKVLCRSIQKNDKPPTAVLRIDKNIQSPSADTMLSPPASESGTADVVTTAGSSAPIGSSNEVSRIRRSQVILDAAARAPFILEAEFRGYCLFRYVTDNQNREERYFRRGETFRTDVRNEIKLWYSNSGAFRVRISGKEIEFGKPGEVGAALLKWVQNETGGGYRLELIPMY